MRDPHVKALHYQLVHDPSVDYQHAPAIEIETDVFKGRLENGKAVFEMKQHFPDREAARAAMQPFLNAWEIWAGLNAHPGTFRLDYRRAEIIDRDPLPGVLGDVIADIFALADKADVHQSLGQYPKPPVHFVAAPEVDEMYRRYERYREGRDILTTTVYVCLTALEALHSNNRAEVARHYAVSDNILDTMGQLAHKGGSLESRKAPHGERHTDRELVWLDAAIRALIRRAGERAADPGGQLRKITMADLPPLS